MADHYAVLGLAPTASDAEIRAAFKRLARKYHPDKRISEVEKLSNPQGYDEHSDALAGTGATNFDEMFSLLSNAYSVLSDAVARAAYDIEVMGTKKASQRNFSESLRRLRQLKKKDAELQTNLMEVTSEQRRENEQKKGGLVFLQAWYGATYALDVPQKHPNEVVDVTRQLQTLVEGSRLVLPKGESKSTSIPGTFDPCPENSDKSLRVQYLFKGKLHMATVRDEDMLLAPMKNHLVSNGKTQGSGGLTAESANDGELRVLLSSGEGQLVQVKPRPLIRENRSRGAGANTVRFMAFVGIAVGVVGSFALSSSKRLV